MQKSVKSSIKNICTIAYVTTQEEQRSLHK